MSFYITPVKYIIVKGKKCKVKLSPSQKRQELFRDVFRIKGGPRDLIFQFKYLPRFNELGSMIKGLKECVKYQYNGGSYKHPFKFKDYNETETGKKYPIKSRNGLYSVIQEYVALSKKLDLVNVLVSPGFHTLSIDLINILMNESISWIHYRCSHHVLKMKIDYDLLFLTDKKFNKNNMKEKFIELKRKHQWELLISHRPSDDRKRKIWIGMYCEKKPEEMTFRFLDPHEMCMRDRPVISYAQQLYLDKKYEEYCLELAKPV